jgi:threonylcarbamoyladenosine tRNA methylthiotransferase MtaB
MSETDKNSGARVVTLGCRLNAYEGQVIREQTRAAGLDDAVIVNTCAVTGEAVRQARQTIRKLRRENPSAKLVVTGCAAQVEPETFAEMGEVDLVLGNAEKVDAAQWRRIAGANDFGIGEAEKVRVNDIMTVREHTPHMIDCLSERTRAFIQVQNGCDHRCTFCIIPFGRGNARSVPVGDAVEQVKRVVGAGHREVVLTGVDLTSYGPDLPGSPRLGTLVEAILKHVPDLPRLRLSSIDSIEADPALMTCMAEPRLMPHLHLSLQSGDDMILKRMKRRHLRDDALRFCDDIRSRRPDVVFGADLIAGFPTETEAMHRQSLAMLEECGLTWLHIFPYSPRKGTPAAKMPPVEGGVIKTRAAELRRAGEARRTAYLASRIGQRERVLVERSDMGRTEGFAEVRFDTPQIQGDIVDVTISGVEDERLTV